MKEGEIVNTQDEISMSSLSSEETIDEVIARVWFRDGIIKEPTVKALNEHYAKKKNKNKKCLWITFMFKYKKPLIDDNLSEEAKQHLMERWTWRDLIRKIVSTKHIEKAFYVYENLDSNFHCHLWCVGTNKYIKQHIKRVYSGECGFVKYQTFDEKFETDKIDYVSGITDEAKKNEKKEFDKIHRKNINMADIYIKNFDRELFDKNVTVVTFSDDKIVL